MTILFVLCILALLLTILQCYGMTIITKILNLNQQKEPRKPGNLWLLTSVEAYLLLHLSLRSPTFLCLPGAGAPVLYSVILKPNPRIALSFPRNLIDRKNILRPCPNGVLKHHIIVLLSSRFFEIFDPCPNETSFKKP